MALRSLDNALPITPERPKKIAKIPIPTQKEKQFAELGVNDENKLPLPQPPSTEASIDYIPSENLKEFQDPDVKIQVLSFCSSFHLFECNEFVAVISEFSV